jgi:hypothetical protein
MPHVRDISELQSVQDKHDVAHAEYAIAVVNHHKSFAAHAQMEPLDKRANKFVAPTGGECECGEANFLVRDATAGREVIVCRDCLNANRRLSLGHSHMTKDICFRCELSYDSFGIVVAANHHTFPIEDFTIAGVSRPGLTSLIVDNKVSIEPGDQIVIAAQVARRTT